MLNAKNGVITEDRFQRLDIAQWLFHYEEVKKFESQKGKEEVDMIKTLLEVVDNRLRTLFEVIQESAKLTGAMANPEAGKAIYEAEKMSKFKADIKDDDFHKWWGDFSQRIPGKLTVLNEGDDVDLEGDAINLEKLHEIEAELIEEHIKTQGGDLNATERFDESSKV